MVANEYKFDGFRFFVGRVDFFVHREPTSNDVKVSV